MGARAATATILKRRVPDLLCTVRNCGAPLVREERRYVCPNAHSFDLARSGYLNLLQPQDRRSREPGDSREAVAARRRFLDRGHEEPLVRAIVSLLPLGNGDALLDAGCGEGHHLGAFQRAYGVDAHGVDISVPAIELAARKYPACTWVVANADRFVPYEDASFDAITSITARMNVSEFRRVLKATGRLLVAVPGPDDLIELRREARDRVQRTVEHFAPHFALERHERIRHVAHLDPQSIEDVARSTYRGARNNEAMDVTLSRDVLVFV